MKADILDDLDDLDDMEEASPSSHAQQSGEEIPLDQVCPLLSDDIFLEHMKVVGELVDQKIKAGRLKGEG